MNNQDYRTRIAKKKSMTLEYAKGEITKEQLEEMKKNS
jgi:hypothetical protein